MTRFLSIAASLVGLVVLCGGGSAGGKGKANNNQMVRGTIKVVDPGKDLLVINQKVKREFVQRELSILDSTQFVVKGPGGKQEATGTDGLRLLEGKQGSSVAVQCDKDVNVLRVTVTIKK
jgi:hypothetical protein